MTSSETPKIKKVIIGDNPDFQYPDGAVTMDEDCDQGYSFWGREG